MYMAINDLSGEVIGAAIEVHRQLGPGLLESSYEACLCRELELRRVPFENQRELSLTYKGAELVVIGSTLWSTIDCSWS